jgi:hypothetical protein
MSYAFIIGSDNFSEYYGLHEVASVLHYKQVACLVLTK